MSDRQSPPLRDQAAHPDVEPIRIEPFLKWPGGKRWLIEAHANVFPNGFDSYIEPFLGAGSVFFHLAPHKAVLGDLNSELISAYRGIKENVDEVIAYLEKHHLNHSEEYYYTVRAARPVSLGAQAARMIYLNRTCFNGIYRVNREGTFNVPVGSRRRVIRSTDNFPGISLMLAGAELRHGDFEVQVDKAQSNDLVFLDPPYTVRHNQNGFIKYNEKLFSWDDQERMAKAATRAVERGARVVITNACHDTIKKLYQRKLFTFRQVSRFSSISAAANSRRRFDEFIIVSKRPRGAHGSI